MIQVPIVNSNRVALIDDEDADLILPHKWYLYIWKAPTYYVQLSSAKMMHHLIIPNAGELVRHHKDGNGLNNRRSNLELITNMENLQHKRMYENNTSGITGVKWKPRLQKWEAQISVLGKRIYLGVYKHKENAIKARIDAEAKYR